ncbi:MAG: hypothetical protein UH850_03605 [Paludibacteraceae bacterium]|nr:hypothetical protein [Paludibacteraceae bacterium]
MKANLTSWVKTWFNDSKEYALDNYALCSEWLSDYVEHCDQEFLNDFFEYEEIENGNVEDLRQIALDWIDENADDIVNFEDYRD